MRRIVTGSLSVSLALLLASLHAEEIRWRTAATSSAPNGLPSSGASAAAPGVSLGRPTPLDAPGLNSSGVTLAAPVALDRPIPFDGQAPSPWDNRPISDPHVMRTAYQATPPLHSESAIRGQNPDEPQLKAKDAAPGKDSAPKSVPGKPEPGPDTKDTVLPVPREVSSEEVHEGDHEEVHEGDHEGELCWDPDHWCFCGGHCGTSHRFYASADYLLWWMKGFPVPALATSSPASNPFANGFLGQPDTTVLFGDKQLLSSPHSGARFTAGYWVDPCQNVGIESSVFFLARRTESFNVGSAASPVISRPFFNLNQGIEFAENVSHPMQSLGGALSINATSQLWGAEANLRKNICCDCCYRLDLLAGFRYLDLYDRLDITELTTFDPAFPQNNPSGLGTVLGKDSFATRNQFYGGQIGAAAEFHRGRWALNLRAKVALGSTHEVIKINGNQFVLAQDGTNRVDTGDLLATPSNIGHFAQNEFSVVPEGSIDISYQITEHIRTHLGYTFIYWSNVVRPGDQIDRVVDTTNIPNFRNGDLPTGQARPSVPFKQSDFWAQGFNGGLEFLW